ncbi:hypothetical protein T4E_6511 [Trichinella pseudospiralis]|uniref:Uncharacterized protein n=1 Tax=Trichinella pseudospiralis TaxID=6337 RepID=A0A0V0YD28_TRIPS|nr:hypothetical protein T4E_6511 [Trichinella pseudospiralis]
MEYTRGTPFLGQLSQTERCDADPRTASPAHRRHPERTSESSGSAHLILSSYCQFDVDKVSREKTVFSIPLELLQFKVMSSVEWRLG